MARRKRMLRSKDVGVFKKTFNRTKKINRASAVQNTGIRL